jgi:adenylyltransferase/sulfurtransferase
MTVNHCSEPAAAKSGSRYARHLALPELGEEGQQRLAQSSVLVVGCGALGSVLSQVMVRAGVGKLRLVDADAPELHNLHRQLLYDENDVAGGRDKVAVATDRLRAMNAAVTVETFSTLADSDNIEQLIAGIDLLLDGTDSFDARYLINEACVKHQIPWIYGGILATTGMTMNIIPGQGPCFRCFMPEAPTADDDLPSCESHGVLATAPLLIAAVQATEAFKILLDSPEVSRKLLVVDIWRHTFQSFAVERRPDCPTCCPSIG